MLSFVHRTFRQVFPVEEFGADAVVPLDSILRSSRALRGDNLRFSGRAPNFVARMKKIVRFCLRHVLKTETLIELVRTIVLQGNR